MPTVDTQTIRRCGPGMILGADGLCYQKGASGVKRAHAKPRKPLLTGGDLNAITKASRAAKRIKAQEKRLQKMGMLPKPAPRRRGPAPVPHHHHPN